MTLSNRKSNQQKTRQNAHHSSSSGGMRKITVQTPRPFASSSKRRYQHATPHKHHHHRHQYHYTGAVTPSPDPRFIPNRSKMTVSTQPRSLPVLLNASSTHTEQRSHSFSQSSSSTPSTSTSRPSRNAPCSMTTITASTIGGKRRYDQQLRQALFGTGVGDHNEHRGDSLLAFGSSDHKRTRCVSPTKLFSSTGTGTRHSSSDNTRMLFLLDNPFRHDVLRSMVRGDEGHHPYNHRSSCNDSYRNYRRHPRCTLECTTALDAPLLNASATLAGGTSTNCRQLLQCGKDYLGILLHQCAYLWRSGQVQKLAQNESTPWTCLCWNEDGTSLALGTLDAIWVFAVQPLSSSSTSASRNQQTKDGGAGSGTDGQRQRQRQQQQQHQRQTKSIISVNGNVTALAWKGCDLLIALENTDWILRKNAEKDTVVAFYMMPPIPRQDGNGDDDSYDQSITCIQHRDDILAVAGGDRIVLWDFHDESASSCRSSMATATTRGNHDGEPSYFPPRRLLHHEGVQSLEFIPKQNLIATSGKGGVHVWNTRNGKLRGSIATTERASGTLCSSTCSQIMVTHGKMITLWNLESTREHLLEKKSSAGNILGLVRCYDDRIVCAHDDETLSIYTFRREVPKDKARASTSSFGLLNTSTLR